MEIAVTEAVPIIGVLKPQGGNVVTRNITLALLTLAVPCGWADHVSPNFHRPTPVRIIANARKIVAPNGVERLEKFRSVGLSSGVRFAELTAAIQFF